MTSELRTAVGDIKEYIDLKLDPIESHLARLNGSVARHEQEIHESEVILTRHEERIAAVTAATAALSGKEKKEGVWHAFDTSQKIILALVALVNYLLVKFLGQ